MRVLLLNPDWAVTGKDVHGKRHVRKWPSLDFAYIARLLEEQGVDWTILDCNVVPVSNMALKTISMSYDKIFVSTSSLDRWQCPSLDLYPAKKIIEAIPDKEIYIIGVHGTVSPEETLGYFGDRITVIQGEPEHTVVEICCSGKGISSISGLYCRSGGKNIKTPERKPIELSTSILILGIGAINWPAPAAR